MEESLKTLEEWRLIGFIDNWGERRDWFQTLFTKNGRKWSNTTLTPIKYGTKVSVSLVTIKTDYLNDLQGKLFL